MTFDIDGGELATVLGGIAAGAHVINYPGDAVDDGVRVVSITSGVQP